MSYLQVTPTWGENAVTGRIPGAWTGVDLPDGDAGDFLMAPVGTFYIYKPNESAQPRLFEKRQDEGRDDDWGAIGAMHCLQQRVELADFTDGGSTSGTVALNQQIPVGAFVVRAVMVDVDDFVAAGAVTVTVGDGTDVDRYNTGTPSLATAVAALDLGAVSGTAIHATAASVTVTVTEATDFGGISAGGFTIRIYYYL